MDQGDAFAHIVALLNEAMLDDARWPGTSALIDEAVGAKGSILTFGGEAAKGNIHIFFSKAFYRGVDRSAWQREYFRDYHGGDEHLRRLRALPDSTIVPVAELFSERERKTSRMYNEALARFDGRKGLTMRLDGPQGARIVWGIADPVDEGGWASSRIDTIARLLPHLRQYVRVRSALADARALGTSVSELLGNARAGVIHLDRGGRIVGANDRALELLRCRDGLADRHGALRAASRKDDRRLQELLSRALPRFDGTGASGSMTVRRPSLLPRLAVHVKPVTNGEPDYRSRQVAALVLIVDPADRARVDPGLVEAALGLTPAQAAIAVLLAEGLAPRRIAAANEQPDRRTPGEVLDAMRRDSQGIYQLGQAVQDFADEQPIRAVDENGSVKPLSDGSGDQTISDIYLRNTFPPPGKARKAQNPGDTPLDRYVGAQNDFDGAMENLSEAFDALLAIRGDDDRPIADVRGVDPELVSRWRDELKRMDEEMIIWVRTYRQTYGTKPVRSGNAVHDEVAADIDPYEVDEQEGGSWSEEVDDETARV